ncbi:hypothetical protein BDV28DRAFT_130048 [Aspergillus coremiiformis]|uniref:Uncharacterized protein n=1 Tax=Aspergillus coremiiformis TaxID=138285 RepID=A0A5N6ZBA9_9EURO|nr:hypothetical protein BDV28DRAFT_130048 [Aspergillus coremiiformis]
MYIHTVHLTGQRRRLFTLPTGSWNVFSYRLLRQRSQMASPQGGAPSGSFNKRALR